MRGGAAGGMPPFPSDCTALIGGQGADAAPHRAARWGAPRPLARLCKSRPAAAAALLAAAAAAATLVAVLAPQAYPTAPLEAPDAPIVAAMGGGAVPQVHASAPSSQVPVRTISSAPLALAGYSYGASYGSYGSFYGYESDSSYESDSMSNCGAYGAYTDARYDASAAVKTGASRLAPSLPEGPRPPPPRGHRRRTARARHRSAVPRGG